MKRMIVLRKVKEIVDGNDDFINIILENDSIVKVDSEWFDPIIVANPVSKEINVHIELNL